jgi:hypothetical protein
LPKTCFVIGPIGQDGTDIRAHADDLIKYIIAPVVEPLGYSHPERADRMPDLGRITTQIIRQLKEADLVIADLTGDNPNVYYELAIRHVFATQGRPVIHMALDGTNIPFDLTDNRTIFFHMHSRLAENAREKLRNAIQRVQEPGYKPSNPIVESLGIIDLANSDQSIDKQVANIALKLEMLSANVAMITDRQKEIFRYNSAESFRNLPLLSTRASNATFGIPPDPRTTSGIPLDPGANWPLFGDATKTEGNAGSGEND